ncbi:MAG: single-stranded DNA-binding protein, partial [Humidesulfovibrio sp.]|nr:single-stranded DNA-binding protein [Humidesulfovibrio sp.]
RVQALGPRPGGGQGGGQGSEGGGYAPRPQGGQQGGQQGNQQGGGQKPPFHDDEDLGPAFPSEASGMDDVPF